MGCGQKRLLGEKRKRKAFLASFWVQCSVIEPQILPIRLFMFIDTGRHSIEQLVLSIGIFAYPRLNLSKPKLKFRKLLYKHSSCIFHLASLCLP